MSADRALAPSMIGRHAQLAECEARLLLAREGAGQVVLIAGEAGIGKSRLVREFLARTATPGDGVAILAGHCYAEESPVPYAPLLEAYRGSSRNWRGLHRSPSRRAIRGHRSAACSSRSAPSVARPVQRECASSCWRICTGSTGRAGS
jgi:hypothetical protein